MPSDLTVPVPVPVPVAVPGHSRTLPLRVALLPGEALNSWLLRLAHRNGISILRLGNALGLADRLRVWRNYALTRGLPPASLRLIEAQTGLADRALDAAVLDQYDPLGWTPVPGSRYCPTCLAGNGGWWPLRWQLPHAFACLTHRCLLAVVCPACRRTPRSRISERSGLAAPTRCTWGASRHGDRCDCDLLAARPPQLHDGDARLAAQAWINQRLDRMDPAAVTNLRDLDALAGWLLQRVAVAELRHLGTETVTAIGEYRDHRHAIKRHQPTAALLAAAMACHAIDIITLAETPDARDDFRRRLAPLLRDVYSKYRTGQKPANRGPMILSRKRLTTLSQPLQHKVLRAIDQQLPVTERLRYRTCAPSPRPPDPNATSARERARQLPQCLWPDWLVRFQPVRGARPDDLAIGITNALLIPGNPARNIHAVGELNPWRSTISTTLSRLTRQHPDVLTAVCNIAEYLDAHGAPIDYRRRRSRFATVDLSQADWEAICAAARVPGGRGARLLHARRHLSTLLTGADLNNPRHSLAFTGPGERKRYRAFGLHMPSTLRTALHDHATRLLAAEGLDEPVTWSPPADCVAGLSLPGREPDDIDTATLHRLVLEDNTSAHVAAGRLGVSTEHVRYAIRDLDGPEAPSRAKPRVANVRARADEILTAEFFEREHVEGGKNIATLAAETGFSPTMLLREYAHRAGIKPVTRRVKDGIKTDRAVRGDSIDPDWLREQAGALRRTNTDIAAELGVSHETIRRVRHDLGIPACGTGTYSDRLHPSLPADIRRVVEGNRAGWQRLRRFQEVAAYRSINLAAAALGYHGQNLNLQIRRLEADLGTELLIRGHRYRPIAPTPRGQRLLDQSQQPEVRALLDQHAPPGAHQTRQPYRHTARLTV